MKWSALAHGTKALPRRHLLGAIILSPAVGVPANAAPTPLPVAGSPKPMPPIGYGTCCRPGAKGEEACLIELVEGVKAYLAAGGRLIDTAQIYGNHEDIAEAIRQSGVKREELWITSKVRVQSCNTPEDVLKAVDTTLRQLDTKYVDPWQQCSIGQALFTHLLSSESADQTEDLMLLHGGDGWGILPDRDEALWRGLIAAQKAGQARSIGLSNHNREEVEQLIAKTKVVPAVNQLEYHPWVPSETKDLVRWCQSQGIVVTAYGSLGGSTNQARGEVVSKVAAKYGRTNAQVLLRWALDQGIAVIPGTNSEQHIREDLDLDFHLDPKDAQLLDTWPPETAGSGFFAMAVAGGPQILSEEIPHKLEDFCGELDLARPLGGPLWWNSLLWSNFPPLSILSEKNSKEGDNGDFFASLAALNSDKRLSEQYVTFTAARHDLCNTASLPKKNFRLTVECMQYEGVRECQWNFPLQDYIPKRDNHNVPLAQARRFWDNNVLHMGLNAEDDSCGS
eukprot:g30451.t1